MTLETAAARKDNVTRQATNHHLDEYPLGEIAMVQQGYTFSPSYQGRAAGKWLYVKVGDLNAHGNTKYLDKTLNYVDDIVLEEMGAKLFPPGSIVFPRVGAALRNNNKRLLRYASLTDDNVIVVTVRDTQACSAEYLYYWFDYQDLQRFCNDGTVPVINGTNLKRQRVPLPGFALQQEIASLLSTWDTAIQKTEQLIAAKERHFSGLVSLLINGPSKSEAWRHVSIRDIANRVQRQGDGGDYPLLTISSASGFMRQEDRYSRYMAGESAKTYTLLRAGEFSYNKGNSKRYEFGCVFQLQNHDAALVPSVYVSFRLNDSVCAAYVRHLFVADYLKPQLRALVKTGVRNNGLLNISPDEFLSTTVPLPPLDQQTKIAQVLDAASADIDLLKRQLAALRVQKRGLMQKLLTGQWRLPVPAKTKEVSNA
jgi:type I restriction enzyme S subunit